MKFHQISTDDWTGYYKDGKLIAQGHSVDAADILKKLGHDVEYKYIPDDDLDVFGDSLPERLEDILNYIKEKK
jgi:hypothetical protein